MRNFYVVAYDVSDDKLRRKVAKFLEGHGQRLQYSVFCCRLNENELAKLMKDLEKLISPEPSATVIFVEAGQVTDHHSQPELIWVGRTADDFSSSNVF
ncbi:MAG: CRISPR-associated endonuclease Cas2 [Succinivibrionaceae bacterium]|nr:CRISPR-associated endonuclease Cas2 [Succinivibrionaceae bacterium]